MDDSEDGSPTRQVVTLVSVGIVALLAFCSVPVNEGFGAAAFAYGLMRAVLAGVVVGIACGRHAARWQGLAAGVLGALVGAVALGVSHPYLETGPLVLQAAGVGVVAWSVMLVVGSGYQKAVTTTAILFICGSFLWQVGILPGTPRTALTEMRHGLALDPVPEQYGFDGEIYARTVSLMKDGTPYYGAFARAFSEDSRMTGEPPGVLNYRQRWLSEVWSLVPGSGRSAPWRTLVGFSITVLLAGYALARRYVEPAAALLAPMWLSTYFVYPLLSIWFPFAEFYGGGLGVISLWLISRQRWFAGAVALTAAVAARELMLVLVPVYIVAWVLRGRSRDEIPALACALLGPAVVIGYHLLVAPGQGASGGSLTTWLQGGGVVRLDAALTFSAELLPFARYLVFGAALAVLAAVFRVPTFWRKAILAGAVVMPIALLFTFSANEWDYYWGAIATPLLLAIGPTAAIWALPSRAIASDRVSREGSGPSKVRIVLPAYNEEASIGDLLVRIGEVMSREKQSYAVLVVDDGSSDRTAEIAESYTESLPVTVTRNPGNLGLGGAILRGLKAASRASGPGDVIVTLDADLTQDPSYIPDLIGRWRDGADIVIASRYRPGSQVLGLSAFRRFMTLGARLGMSTVLFVEGVRDYSCGFRLYDATALRLGFDRYGDALVTERGFACMVEILGRMRSLARVEEVPFVLRYDSKRSASTMRVGATVGAYFRVAFRVNLAEYRRRPQ